MAAAAILISGSDGQDCTFYYSQGGNNLYIFKVDRPNHKTVLATISSASQFWTESPEQFLSHPVFSRDFPQ